MSPQARWPGSPTEKARCTRSGSGGAVTSGTVVLTFRRRPSLAWNAVLGHEPLDALVVDTEPVRAENVVQGLDLDLFWRWAHGTMG